MAEGEWLCVVHAQCANSCRESLYCRSQYRCACWSNARRGTGFQPVWTAVSSVVPVFNRCEPQFLLWHRFSTGVNRGFFCGTGFQPVQWAAYPMPKDRKGGSGRAGSYPSAKSNPFVMDRTRRYEQVPPVLSWTPGVRFGQPYLDAMPEKTDDIEALLFAGV